MTGHQALTMLTACIRQGENVVHNAWEPIAWPWVSICISESELGYHVATPKTDSTLSVGLCVVGHFEFD